MNFSDVVVDYVHISGYVCVKCEQMSSGSNRISFCKCGLWRNVHVSGLNSLEQVSNSIVEVTSHVISIL